MEIAPVAVQLSYKDLIPFLRIMRRRARRPWLPLLAVLGIALVAGTAKLLDLFKAAQRSGGWLGYPGVLMTIFLVGYGSYFYLAWWIDGQTLWVDLTPGWPMANQYRVEEEGLLCENANGRTVQPWAATTEFVVTKSYFFVMRDQKTGHIIPKRSFPSPEAAADFSLCVRQHMKKAELAAQANPVA